MTIDTLDNKADLKRFVEELLQDPNIIRKGSVNGLDGQLQGLRDDIDDLTAAGISGGVFDAKGDLIAGSADNLYDNLTVGSNGTFLKADSTQTLGLIWATLAIADVSGLTSALAAKQDASTAATDSELSAAIAALSSVYQPLDSDLTSIAAVSTTAYGRALLALADGSAARTYIGLGTISTQDSSSVSITGGTITGITDLAVADGGTGASTASAARTNLGLGTASTLDSDTDGTLAANSDSKIATQKATKTYVDAEATTRAAADTTEATARAAADTTEATTRAAADTAESTARAAADTAAIATAEAYSIQRANHTGTQTASTISDFDTQVRTSRLDQMAPPTSNLSINSKKLTNVADGTQPLDGVNLEQLLASEIAAAAGLLVKSTARVASTANVTYDSASATVIQGTGSLSIDGVALATDDRVLLKDQTLGAQNGVWIYAGSGTNFAGTGNFGGSGTFGDPAATWSLTRPTDADESTEFPGMLIPVGSEGSQNGKTSWLLTTAAPITVGTTSLTFSEFSADPTSLNTFFSMPTTLASTESHTVPSNRQQAFIESPTINGTMNVDGDLIDDSPTVGNLTSAHLWVGNSTNTPTDVAMSGDVTISNAGVTAIGSAKVTDTMLASPNNGAYKSVYRSGGFATSLGITTANVVFALGILTGISSGGAGTAVPDQFYFATGDYTVAGLTQKLRVRAQCVTNATAPTVTITFGLYPITASAGASGQLTFTIGAVVSGSTVAFVTPSASTQNQNNSGDFTVPADGYYALGYVGSGTQAANSAVGLTAQLQTRNV